MRIPVERNHVQWKRTRSFILDISSSSHKQDTSKKLGKRLNSKLPFQSEARVWIRSLKRDTLRMTSWRKNNWRGMYARDMYLGILQGEWARNRALLACSAHQHSLRSFCSSSDSFWIIFLWILGVSLLGLFPGPGNVSFLISSLKRAAMWGTTKEKKNYAGSENHSPHKLRKRSHFGTEYRKALPPWKGKEKQWGSRGLQVWPETGSWWELLTVLVRARLVWTSWAAKFTECTWSLEASFFTLWESRPSSLKGFRVWVL